MSESDLKQGFVSYEIVHETTYSYEKLKRSSVMTVCMQPKATATQLLDHYQLSTTPDSSIDIDIDPFGNTRHFFDIHRPHNKLTVTSNARVRTHPHEDKIDVKIDCWEDLVALRSSLEFWDFLLPTDLTRTQSDLDTWTDQQGGIDKSNPWVFLKTLEQRLSTVIRYRPGATTIDSTVDDLLRQHEGVCQDISQLMIAIARSKGIPARYVSGYLYVAPNATRRLVDNATHAWVDCYLPGSGWCTFDPTNPEGTQESRVTVAYGRDYRDVPPIRGITFGGGEAVMDVSVMVFRQPYGNLSGPDKQS